MGKEGEEREEEEEEKKVKTLVSSNGKFIFSCCRS